MKVVFLDFDGVLHPVGSEDKFCYVDTLSEIIGSTPVVVSSSWGEVFSLEELKGILPNINVIGKTTLTEAGMAEKPESRYNECIDWLEENGMWYSDWIAIDDNPSLFDRDNICANLIMCYPREGLSPHSIAAQELREWIIGRQR